MTRVLASVFLAALVLVVEASAESSTHLITESTATVTITDPASVIAVVDLGVRRTSDSGWGYGFSAYGGGEFFGTVNNERDVLGFRLRLGKAVSDRGYVEGFLGISKPGSRVALGANYYPIRSLGVVLQVDNVAGWKETGGYSRTPERKTKFSAGVKLASSAGTTSWVVGAVLAGVVALIAISDGTGPYGGF